MPQTPFIAAGGSRSSSSLTPQLASTASTDLAITHQDIQKIDKPQRTPRTWRIP